MKLGFGFFDGGLTMDEVLDCTKGAGFDAAFSDGAIASRVDEMKKFRDGCEKRGLLYETSHSDLYVSRSLWNPGDASELLSGRGLWHTDSDGEGCLGVLKGCVDNCKAVNVPILIIHVAVDPGDEKNYDRGRELISDLVAHAKKQGVKLAFENINTELLLRRILHDFPEDHVGFCYDSGHSLCLTPPKADYTDLFDRLFCVHLHDNMGTSDIHDFPFTGINDFAREMPLMRKAGYQGVITIEMGYKEKYHARYTPQEFFNEAYRCAVRLAELYEG